MTSPIGVSRPRPDAPAKVRGWTRYGADRPIHGLLHARLVLAGRAHARINGIDASEAMAVPGVVAVLTAADLPIRGQGFDRLSLPLARDEVIFAGQPVALVVADTLAAAADAAELVTVDLEPLPTVLDPEAAMAPGAPRVRHDVDGAAGPSNAGDHAAVGGGETVKDSEPLSANVVDRTRFATGDAAAALSTSDVIAEGRFTTSWTYQAYLEPQVSTARFDPDGSLVVETATQASFGTQSDVSRALDIPTRRVRVVPTPLGGAFGGKWALFEPLVASAAVALERPVRLALTRLEDLAATNPAQGIVAEVRVGAGRDGTLRALEARIIADTGAFDEGAIHSFLAILLAGPYAWPAYDLRTYGVRTNRVGGGAYRGPGGPPMAFAIETLLDELADRLGLDPIELRQRNLVEPGMPMLDGERWPAIGAKEVLDAMAASRVWRSRGRLPAGEGVGVALGVWPGAIGPAAAACRVSRDGSIQITTGSVDMSGVGGGFQALVADALGVDPDLVEVVTVDTGSAPPSPGSGGSKITYSVGRAVRRAAEDARDQLLEAAARQLEIAAGDLELVGGAVQPKGTPDRAIPIAKLVRATERAGGAPIEGHGRTDSPSLAPQVAGHVVHVRVDEATGEVEVVEDLVAQDVGRALNPALIRDQQLGASMQAIGWARYEALVHDTDGGLASGSFLDYAVPRANSVGRLEGAVVEVPAPDGPLGAKGVGESPVIPGAAAVANAIAAATGLRLRSLPMTAPRVWRALRERAT